MTDFAVLCDCGEANKIKPSGVLFDEEDIGKLMNYYKLKNFDSIKQMVINVDILYNSDKYKSLSQNDKKTLEKYIDNSSYGISCINCKTSYKLKKNQTIYSDIGDDFVDSNLIKSIGNNSKITNTLVNVKCKNKLCNSNGHVVEFLENPLDMSSYTRYCKLCETCWK